MKEWVRRAGELHDEVSAVADVGRADPRWWLVAAGAAVVEPWPARGTYMVSDAEPGADTFMGYHAPAPTDVVGDAIARAHAARAALRELDGTLPDQPLDVTVLRDASGAGATTEPSGLDTVAFAIGGRIMVARLADDIASEQPLADLLARAIAEGVTASAGFEAYVVDAGVHIPDTRSLGKRPFVAIALGNEPLATARHGHRRAWRPDGGPWLGLGRAGELAIVSTCHMVVDGFGHGRLAGLIAAHHARLAGHAPSAPVTAVLPPLATPAGATPLGIAWRPLDGSGPRAIRLGYALGRVLHRRAGRLDARFSPTFQIPVAPGRFDDDTRRRRRVVFSITSVRFDDGAPEPYDVFASRAREILAREASGIGLCARMLAAARATPAPLAWKRRQFSATRPRWLDRISDVLGGRACLSRITLDATTPPLCAVSSPSRLATRGDPFGACVLTVIDDGTRSAITACGSGLAGNPADATTLIDELLAIA